MNLRYEQDGFTSVDDMVDYVEGMSSEFPVRKLNRRKVTTPGTTVAIFKDVESKRLTSQRSDVFHIYIAKALFLAK